MTDSETSITQITQLRDPEFDPSPPYLPLTTTTYQYSGSAFLIHLRIQSFIHFQIYPIRMFQSASRLPALQWSFFVSSQFYNQHVFHFSIVLHKGTGALHKYFLALARTRISKTGLRIDVCAVWKGFNMVWINARQKEKSIASSTMGPCGMARMNSPSHRAPKHR